MSIRVFASLAASALACLQAGAGVNLIVDHEVNATPLADEFRLVSRPNEGLCAISRFEEDRIWNGCVKLEVCEIGKSRHKPRQPNKLAGECLDAAVEIGGSTQLPGFPVKGGDTLKFSFVVRGTVPEAVALFPIWNAAGERRQMATTVRRFKVGKDWMPVKGEIELPADAVRAALMVQLWYDEKYGPMIYRVGDFLLLDKFDIQRKTNGREIWPARAVVLPADGSAADLGGLRDIVADSSAKAQTSVRIRYDAEALYLNFACKRLSVLEPTSETGVFPRSDDHVEIFLGEPNKGGVESHFAVSSGGGRWMAGSDYTAWTAHVTRNDETWTADVRIPWTTAGFAAMPKTGEPIAFQVCRTRILGPVADKSGERGNAQGYARWLDRSSWNFCKGEFTNKDMWGVIFLSDMGGLDVADPTTSWRRHREEREAARMRSLLSQPFALAQVPTSIEPEIPFMPEELFDPQPLFSAKAAGNERMFIPVALANLTDEFEEYRVVLSCGWHRPGRQNEIPVIRFGLKRNDGLSYPDGKIRLLRGVKYRESDASGHAKRYDPLVPLDAISSVPVPSKESGLVWIEFDTHGVEPGVYRGEFVVTPLSSGCCRKSSWSKDGVEVEDDSKSVPVEFEVRPFELPEPSEMGLFSYGRAYTDYAADFMNGYGEVLRMLSPWNFEADFDADGNLVKRRPRPWTEAQLKLLRDRSKKFGKLPRISLTYAIYWHFREVTSKGALFVRGSESFWKAYREWVKYVDDVLVSNGVARDDYCAELLDEPSPTRGMPVAEAVRAAKETKAAVPGMKIFVTSGFADFFKPLKDIVDGWVLYHERHYPVARQWAMETGKFVSVYNCNTSMRVSPYRYFRNLAWRSACAGGDFCSIYQFLYSIPSVSIRKAPYGDYAYDTGREILSSVRGENLYLGLCDIRYLKLLRKLAVGDSASAKSGRAMIERALKEVTFTRDFDVNAADEFREKASELIVKLMKGSPR